MKRAPTETIRSARQAWNSTRMLQDPAWYPNEQIVRFIVKYLKKRSAPDHWEIRKTVRNVLDLGCGTGRHLKLLAEQGFSAHGLDIAFNNLLFAADWLRGLNLRAHCLVGSSDRLPYRQGAFDVVISHGVLDHMTFREASATAREVRRVLQPDGIFYLDLISKQDSGFGQGTPVEKDAFIVPDGSEAGVVQRFYDEQDIQKFLNPAFRVAEVIFQQWYPVVGGGLSNLDKAGRAPARLARFHVVAMPR